MARLATATQGGLAELEAELEVEEQLAEEYYRDLLSGPAVLPWADLEWKPLTLGPTWQVADDGGWLLPGVTAGWQFLSWTSVHLRIDGEHIRWTPEQARFWLHWWSVEPDLSWTYRDGTFQRLKGHGKDPMAAALGCYELVGPSRVKGIDSDGRVVCVPHPSPWVDVAAVTQAQTKTTMRLLPAMIPRQTRKLFRIGEPGKTVLYARAEEAFLQAVTSNPAALEGNRSTLVIMQEPHHWKEANGGHEMSSVLKRNTTKAKRGGARKIRFTNAYQPGLDSVGERDREGYETGKTDGYLYDTLEAPRNARLDRESAPEVIRIIKGDSWWLNDREILAAINEVETGQATEAEIRRFWYNQVEGHEDAWLDPRAFADAAKDGLMLNPGDPVVIFFDGSKSQDATALVACRIEDGAVFVLGLWQPARGKRVSRDAVDWAVTTAVRTLDVWGLWGDPSDAMDDETGAAYWTPVLDAWHERWGDSFVLPAVKDGHSIVWDMRDPKHQREFVAAAQQFVDDVERDGVPHPNDKRLVRHVRNARKRPGKYGVGLGKESRGSRRKVDLAVCAVGARMMRRRALTLQQARPRRSSRVAGGGK